MPTYLTLGGYDLVAIGEAPDDKTMARAILMIVGQGNVRATTMRAFNEAQIRDIVSSPP